MSRSQKLTLLVPSESVKRAKSYAKRTGTSLSAIAHRTFSQLVDQALASSLKDFKDALQYHCWIRSGADFLLTRNLKDFPRDKRLMYPATFLTHHAE